MSITTWIYLSSHRMILYLETNIIGSLLMDYATCEKI